jgi:hypothetical protein
MARKGGGGKWTKPPINARTLGYAKSDAPSTWSTFNEAAARVMAGEADGIGFCLHGANTGAVDLDKCHDHTTGAIAPWAQAIIDRAPSGTYLEVTVSGTGLRLIGIANGKYLLKKYTAPNGDSFELYRNAPKYITVSGLALARANGPLANIDELLDALHAEEEAKRADPRKPATGKKQPTTQQALAGTGRTGKWARGGMCAELFELIANGVAEPNRSTQFFHAVAWLKRLDWSIVAIVWLLEKHPNGIASKYNGRLLTEVDRVFDKVELSGDNLGDFFAFAPQHTFMEIVTRKPWPAISIDTRLPPVALIDDDGQLVRAVPEFNRKGEPVGNPKGEPILLKPSVWLDRNRSINGITWAPGMPLLVFDKVVVENIGWIDAPGKVTFNTYRPPEPKPGDFRKVTPWIRLINKVYDQHAYRIIMWFAYRTQHPDVKINHGLVFGGVPNIGKDTIIEGAREAVGGWNCREASPQDLFEPYNGFVKAVILRISENRDTGEQSQHAMYNKMKTYLAAPPPTMTVNEKYISQYDIMNVCGTIITTNYKETGLFLPPDDRRHHVLWSERKPEDFSPEDFKVGTGMGHAPTEFTPEQEDPTYWDWMYTWYNNGGYEHVAAFLRRIKITNFNPKAPPPKTEAFWCIANANRAREESELEEVLAIMGDPPAVTLSQMLRQQGPPPDLEEWLKDRRNRRVIPKHMETAGYSYVHNPDSGNGLWRVAGPKQAVYARTELTVQKRIAAARDLVAEEEARAAEEKEAAEARARAAVWAQEMGGGRTRR